MTIDQIITEASFDLVRPEYIDTAEAAKLMRPALREAFPGVKFSVRIERYSGGSSINIHWADGPASRAVEKITDQYSGGSFDGMIDMEYSWASWLSPDGKHVVVAHSEGTGDSHGSVPASYSDRPALDWRLVHFSCKYIHASRTVTNYAETAKAAAFMVRARYGLQPHEERIGHDWGEYVRDVADRIVHIRDAGETLEAAMIRYLDGTGRYA